MKKRRDQRVRHPRLAFAYLLCMVVLTIGILAIVLHSIWFQRQEIASVTASNLELQMERLAIETQRRTWILAEKALGDLDPSLLESLTRSSSPQDLEEARTTLLAVRGRHPIVGEWMLADANRRALPGLLNDAVTFFRRLPESTPSPAPVAPDQIRASAIPQDEATIPIFYRTLPSDRDSQALFGFIVSIDWVSDGLLRQAAENVGLEPMLSSYIRMAQKQPPLAEDQPGESLHELADEPDLRVSLGALYADWELAISPAFLQARKGTLQTDLLLIVISAGILLSVLLVGLVLLFRTTRLLHISQLRSDFVSSVSHELKTPLTLIRLYGETLAGAGNLGDSDRRAYCDIILRETDRLNYLIEQVLDFGRVEKGKKKFQLSEGNLALIIRSTAESYANYLKQRGFEVKTYLEESLPPVRFDPDSVSQAVLNLMDNARKYSGDSNLIEVSLYARGDQVVFSVVDYGIGIPKEEQSKIFEEFYRVSSDSGRNGYGLGLFLIENIMKAHGGGVELESTPGKGSCFRLNFPVAASVPERAPRARDGFAAGRTRDSRAQA